MNFFTRFYFTRVARRRTLILLVQHLLGEEDLLAGDGGLADDDVGTPGNLFQAAPNLHRLTVAVALEELAPHPLCATVRRKKIGINGRLLYMKISFPITYFEERRKGYQPRRGP